MNYVHELRQMVGSRPIILAGATVLILNPKDQLLMILRTDNHCWGLPGGMMEPGESLQETAQRETNEEVGLDVKEMELFGVYSGPDFFYEYPNGDQVYNVSVAYLARYAGQAILIDPEEHSEYKFFGLNELPENVSPPIRPILKDLVQRYLFTANKKL